MTVAGTYLTVGPLTGRNWESTTMTIPAASDDSPYFLPTGNSQGTPVLDAEDAPDTEDVQDSVNVAPLPSEPQDAASHDHQATEGDDDDDITVIILDPTSEVGRGATLESFNWIELFYQQPGPPEMEERRRNILLRELRHVQRSSFIHFMMLCMIPTILLIVVVGTVFGGVESCGSEVSLCELEPRTFMTAFTTQCVCESIPIARDP